MGISWRGGGKVSIRPCMSRIARRSRRSTLGTSRRGECTQLKRSATKILSQSSTSSSIRSKRPQPQRRSTRSQDVHAASDVSASRTSLPESAQPVGINGNGRNGNGRGREQSAYYYSGVGEMEEPLGQAAAGRQRQLPQLEHVEGLRQATEIPRRDLWVRIPPPQLHRSSAARQRLRIFL